MRIKTTGGMLAKRQPFAQVSVSVLDTLYPHNIIYHLLILCEELVLSL